MKRQRVWRVGIGLGVLVLAGVIAAALRTNMIPAAGDIPVTHVRRGNLNLKVYAMGELSTQRSVPLAAPPVGGGALQITHLLRTGTPVKAGDLVVEFDPGEQIYKLEQSRSELLQAEQEIAKAQADATVQTAQDKSALLKAKFDVRRAELEVGRNETMSAIDAKKNDLTLASAKRALEQLIQDIQSHAASGQATIAVAEEKRHKAELAMKQAQQNIENMRVRSAIDGLVIRGKNQSSTGGVFFNGMSFPDYREGDQTEAGSIVAQVVDAKGMEMTASVGERDRGNIQIGQAAEVNLDALPGIVFHGKVKTASEASSPSIWENTRGFAITVELADADPRLRPGFTGRILILGNQRKNVLYVARPAVFDKDGKSIVYVRSGSGFEAREVKMGEENEGNVVVEGLKEGTEIALVNPDAQAKKTPASAGPALGPGGRTP